MAISLFRFFETVLKPIISKTLTPIVKPNPMIISSPEKSTTSRSQHTKLDDPIYKHPRREIYTNIDHSKHTIL